MTGNLSSIGQTKTIRPRMVRFRRLFRFVNPVQSRYNRYIDERTTEYEPNLEWRTGEPTAAAAIMAGNLRHGVNSRKGEPSPCLDRAACSARIRQLTS